MDEAGIKIADGIRQLAGSIDPTRIRKTWRTDDWLFAIGKAGTELGLTMTDNVGHSRYEIVIDHDGSCLREITVDGTGMERTEVGEQDEDFSFGRIVKMETLVDLDAAVRCAIEYLDHSPAVRLEVPGPV